MKTLFKLNFQLEKLKSLIIKDYVKKSVYNSYILKDIDDDFLSTEQLISFITKNKVNNYIIFNEIVNNCYAIIHISKYEIRQDVSIKYKVFEQRILNYDNHECGFDINDIHSEAFMDSWGYSNRIIYRNEVDFHFDEVDSTSEVLYNTVIELTEIEIICEEIINIILKSFPDYNFSIDETMIFFDKYMHIKKHPNLSTYQYDQFKISRFPIKVISTEDLKLSFNYSNIYILGNKTITKEFDSSYYHIFKFNSFKVWQNMFVTFQINEKSRIDIKFMFEIMQEKGLIHDTVSQKYMLDWILKKYDLNIEKTSHNSFNEYRLSVFKDSLE